MGVYGAAVTAGAVGLRRRNRPLPDVRLFDIALVGVATHKLARRVSKDSVTSSLRAPFTRYEGVAGPAELQERVRGSGLRKAVGELVTCPFCISQWVSTGLHLRPADRAPGHPLDGIGVRLAGPGRFPPVRLRLGGTTGGTSDVAPIGGRSVRFARFVRSEALKKQGKDCRQGQESPRSLDLGDTSAGSAGSEHVMEN